MALFRLGPSSDNATFIRGEGVYLRPPEMHDFETWAGLRERSRGFLTPWEPTWPGDDLTRTAFRRRLRRQAQEIENDEGYPFLIFREGDDVLVGGLTLGQIKRGVAQAATLGYWMGAPHAGKGFMSRAVRAAVTSPLRRSGCIGSKPPACRIMIPPSGCSNAAGSSAKAMRVAYLRINGIWQDHLLYALLESDPIPLRLPRRDKA